MSSRITKEEVWFNTYHHLSHHRCQVCNVAEMVANDSSTWQRGHIFSASLGGPDICINLIPMCGPCNRKMGNLTLFEYLYATKQMSREEAERRQREHQAKIDRYLSRPQCSGTHKNGNSCSNRRVGTWRYCLKHLTEQTEQMDTMEDNIW